jgi:hypothetical protein
MPARASVSLAERRTPNGAAGIAIIIVNVAVTPVITGDDASAIKKPPDMRLLVSTNQHVSWNPAVIDRSRF